MHNRQRESGFDYISNLISGATVQFNNVMVYFYPQNKTKEQNEHSRKNDE